MFLSWDIYILTGTKSVSIKKFALILVLIIPLLILAYWQKANNNASAQENCTHYIKPSGHDSNNGASQNTAWKTISKANSFLAAGDTVCIDQGEYEEQINPINSGSKNGGYITFKSLDMQKPAVITNIKMAVELSNRSYVMIDGIRFDGKGEYSGSKIVKTPNIDQWLYMDSAHHNIIKNSTFIYANGYTCFRINNDSHHNKVINNHFEGCGTWDKNDPQVEGGQRYCGGRCSGGNDSGDLFRINCSWSNLVEGNSFNRVGHDPFSVHGWDNVVRNNILENWWVKDQDPNNYWGTIGGKGNRAGSFTWHPDECTKVDDRWKHSNLLEGNVIKNSMPPSDQPKTGAFKIQGINVIVRKNQFYNNNYMAITTVSRNKVEHNDNIKIYNNVFFNNGSAVCSINRNPGWETLNNITFKNNIVWQNRQAPLEQSPLNNPPINENRSDFDLFFMLIDNNQRNNQVIANSIVKEKPGDALIVMTDDQHDYPPQPLNWYQQNYPDNFYQNIEKLPLFADENPDGPDFHLKADSPMIDAGDYLTRTVSAGSGKDILVDNAAYFMDGFDIVEGDMIQVGDNGPVRVVEVDYKNNVITVEKSILWQANDGVSLPYSGNKPDIGAFEYEHSTSPSPPPKQIKCFDSSDSIINSNDVLAWIKQYALNHPLFELLADNFINSMEFSYLMRFWEQSCN